MHEKETYKTNSWSHVGEIPLQISVSRVTFWSKTRTNVLVLSKKIITTTRKQNIRHTIEKNGGLAYIFGKKTKDTRISCNGHQKII